MTLKSYNTGIYKITNSVTGKVYIGSADNLRKRKQQHFSSLEKNKHHSVKLQRSYNIHGKEAFSTETILYCTKADLLFYEQLLIDFYKSYKSGYNSVPMAGSSIGAKRSNDMKARISETVKRHWENQDYRNRCVASAKAVWTDEKRIAQSEKVKGTKHSESHKMSISVSGKKRFENPIQLEMQKQILDSARQSPSRKINVAAALRTPEYREKQSAIITAWWAKRKAEKIEKDVLCQS